MFFLKKREKQEIVIKGLSEYLNKDRHYSIISSSFNMLIEIVNSKNCFRELQLKN